MCSNQLSYVALPTCSVASGAYYANLLALRQPFFLKKRDFLFVWLMDVQFVRKLHKKMHAVTKNDNKPMHALSEIV
jgi:hypothetical protein